MNKEEPSCINCQISLDNPVCSSCWTKEAGVFLMNYDLDSYDVSCAIKDMEKKLESMKPNNDGPACVVCEEELVSLCPDCYLMLTKNILSSYFPNDAIKKLNLIYSP